LPLVYRWFIFHHTEGVVLNVEAHREHQVESLFIAPPGTCDAHFHVFGPADRYPHGGVNEKLRYAPPYAPLEDYLAEARQLGFERFVFVQPSAYGRDNACMLESMAQVPGSRGIVDVDEDAPDAVLAKLDAAGVRGVRINVSPVKQAEAGFAESLLPRISHLDARCAEIGWHLDFLLPGWLTLELMETLRRLRAPFSLAHMGMFLAAAGAEQPGFVQLLDLLRHGEGRAWVKLTGSYRISTAPGFPDVDPMVRALIAAAPDRLIWGSDYPHLSFADKVGTVGLFNLIHRWAPDEATKRRILVENPARLFGF
jgi:predicted TIM-barrel fold metal-dependent hydrolase